MVMHPYPNREGVHRRVYLTPSPGSGFPVQTWTKPSGVSFVHIWCLGGGAGGGGGSTGATGTIRGGGGGGGSGAVASAIFPAAALPELLYIGPGPGGAGGAAGATGVTGTIGQRSTVNVTQVAGAANNTIMFSGNANAGGGVGGSTSAGTGGAAGSVANSTTALWTMLGVWQGWAGVIGAAAGAVTGAPGVAVTFGATSIFAPGAGGGTTPASNADSAGGDQTGAAVMQTLPGGVAGGGAGANGRFLWTPMCGQGGAGGGTNGASGVGGKGGDGGYGCGGGGGGGGVTGGAGGKGGDGLVIITCW